MATRGGSIGSGSGYVYGHLKLRHLQLLALLDELGSITDAARVLNLTQPAVSVMLRELESQFGVLLVERSRRGVTLTVAAKAALRRFRIAMAEIDASRDDALQAERQLRSRIRVGALTVAMVELIPQVVARFIAQHDDVQVQISEGTVDDLSERLLGGELDLVVGRLGLSWARSPEAGQLEQTKLFDEPRCIVCRTGHRLAGKATPPLSRLAQESWVLQPVPSSTRHTFDEMFLLRGLTPPLPRIESASAHSCLDIVARTDLLSVCPRALARRPIEQGRLQDLGTPRELGAMAISVIGRRSGSRDPLIGAFRDGLVAVARELTAARGPNP